jgi:integrase
MTSGLAKSAKVLTDKQVAALLRFVESETRYQERNRVVVLLSYKAGMRAKEIACLKWSMLTDAEGALTDSISLTNDASKGRRGGRVVPLHAELKVALETLYAVERAAGRGDADGFVITLQRGSEEATTRANSVVFLFKSWYASLGFKGASSHSGRRTFITKAARKVSEVGGSLRDVQSLAGHANIAMTQRYVDIDPEAQRKLIDRL